MQKMLNVSQKLTNNPEDIDAILITGNFIHPQFMMGITTADELEYKWAVMKEIIANTTKQIERKFPGKPILPAFGPTDNLFGYMAPETANLKLDIYDAIYGIWFEKYEKTGRIYSSLTDGGYYVQEINKNL